MKQTPSRIELLVLLLALNMVSPLVTLLVYFLARALLPAAVSDYAAAVPAFLFGFAASARVIKELLKYMLSFMDG